MEKNLWTNIEKSEYSENKELYQNHILEQYKMYVEMADRISSRRNLANIFFLTLNTTILGVIGFLFEKIQLINPSWLIIFPLLGILTLTIVWWWLLRSYRNLNSAKFKVVGHLEKKLPSSPYWSAEWKELGEGKDLKKYLPLTVLEKFVPIVFGILYIMIGIFVIFWIK
jgi:hypothetical protein